ncbi:MAG TPA: DUF488 domain-containing protein [Caulobacteraceae bacterium]|nr:DUF488 domain-containing protein [Caulobacteraceae bacterium]
MNAIATIGYEGATPDAFDAALLRADIELVVDVRAVAISRKRGFSKTALSERLRNLGFDYIHLRGLGDPKPGREAARAGDMVLFREIFDRYLATAVAKSELEKLLSLALEKRVALLCYEADPEGCHRTIVANSIAKLGNLSILHLKVESERAANSGRSRTDNYSGESVAAA